MLQLLHIHIVQTLSEEATVVSFHYHRLLCIWTIYGLARLESNLVVKAVSH